VTALADLLIPMACAVLWMVFGAPAILRSFGLPVVPGTWRMDRSNQPLSTTQYVWAWGVFRCGIGMFLFFAISRYLDWRLRGDSFSRLSPKLIFGALLIWLAVGWVVGVMGAPYREHADSTKR
jgi:hypothetical protein